MAIKERKQITGTTAQIQAYAGHEGQIVWDKDKKTFVGMSGTAGKNYPLAPQAYVDNEVSKVNAEVAKKQPQGNYATTSQLTEGLAGKEDAGVCLPLTGGNMSGGIVFNNLASISNQTTSEHEQVMFQVFDSANMWSGGLLACRGHSGSNEAERGSFALGARSIDGSIDKYLIGTPAGNLLWAGNEVLRVTGSGNGWVRFTPNLQICFGVGSSGANGYATLNYGVPFSVLTSVITTISGDRNASGYNWSILTQTLNINSFTVTTFSNGGLAPNVGFYWCAIGYYN